MPNKYHCDTTMYLGANSVQYNEQFTQCVNHCRNHAFDHRTKNESQWIPAFALKSYNEPFQVQKHLPLPNSQQDNSIADDLHGAISNHKVPTYVPSSLSKIKGRLISSNSKHVLQITIQDRNYMPDFLCSMPLVKISVKPTSYTGPQFVVVACIKSSISLNKYSSFHQQFAFKMCYRCSDLFVYLQVYGDDTNAMIKKIAINGIPILLTPATLGMAGNEFLMGHEGCIEHYSQFHGFMNLFINKDGSANKSMSFNFEFGKSTSRIEHSNVSNNDEEVCIKAIHQLQYPVSEHNSKLCINPNAVGMTPLTTHSLSPKIAATKHTEQLNKEPPFKKQKVC